MESPFELPPTYRVLQAEARELADSVADIVERADESDGIDPAMRARLAASGLASLTVPPSSAGGAGAGAPRATPAVPERWPGRAGTLAPIFPWRGTGSFPPAPAGG